MEKEKGEKSTPTEAQEEDDDEQESDEIPSGLTEPEFHSMKPSIEALHKYRPSSNQCSSLLAHRIYAPAYTVWSLIRKFDEPQLHKHFIKTCTIRGGHLPTSVGCLREVNVISGLPASTSTERLDILDDDLHVTGFSIVGGEHRLRNYRSVTSLHESSDYGKISTVVLESYAVDVPEGNTVDDTRLFADTVVRLNLQKLASVAEDMVKTDS